MAEDDNTFAIGNLMVQMDDHHNTSDSEDLSSIQPSQLNLNIDNIEPSLFMPSEEERTSVTGEQEISSTIRSIGPVTDEPRYIHSHLEEPFEIPPPHSYLGLAPYAAVYQNPSTMPYPYSSTPFHSVIPYGYPQVLEMAPPHVRQLYMKRIFHPEIISPNMASQHLNHTIASHHSSGLSNFAMKPSSSSISENLCRLPYKGIRNMNEGLNEILAREDSGFIDENAGTNGVNTEVCTYRPNLPSEGESVDLKPRFFNGIQEVEEGNVMSSSHLSNRIKGETNYPNSGASENFEEQCRKSEKFATTMKERIIMDKRTFSESSNSSEECYTSEESVNNSYNKSMNQKKDKTSVNKESDDNIDPLHETEKERIRPERYRKCKSLFQKISSNDRFRSQLVKGAVKSRSKANGNGDLLSCSQCDYSSYNKSNFKNHLFIHSDERLFACPYCSYRGKQSAGLRAHLKVHSVEKPFKCSICSYKCKRKQNLIQHFRIHSKYRPFLCTYCEYKSTTKQSLQKHMSKHFGETSSKSIANTNDDNNNDGDEEEDNEEGEEEEEDEEDADNDNSKRNLDVYEDKCEDNSFNTADDKSILKSRLEEEKMVTSTQDNISAKDYPILECPQCEFSSVRRTALKNHIKTHDNDFYECSFCEYKSKLAGNLRLHMAGHKKSNNLKCNSCDFESSSATQFINHLKLHKRKVDFTDDLGTSSLSKDTSVKSRKEKNSTTLFPQSKDTFSLQCPYCDFECQVVAYLKLHITNHCDEDLWTFVRHLSNLVNERSRQRYSEKTFFKDRWQSPADVINQNEATKNSSDEEMKMDESENTNVAKEFHSKHSKLQDISGSKNMEPDIKLESTAQNVPVMSDNSDGAKRSEQTLNSAAMNQVSSLGHLKWNATARKKVFKSLRNCKQPKRKILSKNMQKIKSRMELESQICKGRRKKQKDCVSEPPSNFYKQAVTTLESDKIKVKNESRETMPKTNLSTADDDVKTKTNKTENESCENIKINSDKNYFTAAKSDDLSISVKNTTVHGDHKNNGLACDDKESGEKSISHDENYSSIDSYNEDCNSSKMLKYDPPFYDVKNFELMDEDFENSSENYKVSESPQNQMLDSKTPQYSNFVGTSNEDLFHPSHVDEITETQSSDYSSWNSMEFDPNESATTQSLNEITHSNVLSSDPFTEQLNFPNVHPKDLLNARNTSNLPSTSTDRPNERTLFLTEEFKYNETSSGRNFKYTEREFLATYADSNTRTALPSSDQNILKSFLLSGNYKRYGRPNNPSYEQTKEGVELSPSEITNKFKSGVSTSEFTFQQNTDKEIKTESKLLTSDGYNLGHKNDSQNDVDECTRDESTIFKGGNSNKTEVLERSKVSEGDYSDLCPGLNEDSKRNSEEINRTLKTEMFKCNTCDSKFRRKSSLVNHKRSHVKDLFKCSKCPFTFRYKKAMEDHEKTHPKEKMFKCSDCDFSSLRKCSLMSHYRIHRRKFKCMYCTFRCSLIKRMEKHYAKHKQEGRMKCFSRHFAANIPQPPKLNSARQVKQCGSDSKSADVGVKEEGTVAVGESSSSSSSNCLHECEICSLNFKEASDLRDHLFKDHSLENNLTKLGTFS